MTAVMASHLELRERVFRLEPNNTPTPCPPPKTSDRHFHWAGSTYRAVAAAAVVWSGDRRCP